MVSSFHLLRTLSWVPVCEQTSVSAIDDTLDNLRQTSSTNLGLKKTNQAWADSASGIFDKVPNIQDT